jgi:hypothetical protein
MALINIGFGNLVESGKITAVLMPDSAPQKRLVQKYKENDKALDATSGRRTRGIIVMDDGRIVLSALSPEAIAQRSVNALKIKEEAGND